CARCGAATWRPPTASKSGRATANGEPSSLRRNTTCCGGAAPNPRARARSTTRSARARLPARVAILRCSPRRPNTTARPAGRASIGRCRTPSAPPPTTCCCCRAPRCIAGAAAGLWAKSSRTAPRPRGWATASTAVPLNSCPTLPLERAVPCGPCATTDRFRGRCRGRKFSARAATAASSRKAAMIERACICLAVAVAGWLATTPASAADQLKIAVGQREIWHGAPAALGERAGIFRKHDLDLELLFTSGSGETMQAVIAGSVDIGVAAGTLRVMGAYAKGAPVRIIGAESTGEDSYWYVRADSPVKSMADMKGRTMAYSTNGSSTHANALAFVELYKVDAKLIATGGFPATFTMVMSGQIDAGWSAPPYAM